MAVCVRNSLSVKCITRLPGRVSHSGSGPRSLLFITAHKRITSVSQLWTSPTTKVLIPTTAPYNTAYLSSFVPQPSQQAAFISSYTSKTSCNDTTQAWTAGVNYNQASPVSTSVNLPTSSQRGSPLACKLPKRGWVRSPPMRLQSCLRVSFVPTWSLCCCSRSSQCLRSRSCWCAGTFGRIQGSRDQSRCSPSSTSLSLQVRISPRPFLLRSSSIN